MNTSNQPLPNALILEVPEPPEEFGQDGGKFYKAYDAIAEEIDEDMTKSLKEQLDGMLIFAGLFAGVNSAFLALTLPLMSADPADDTNALLAQNNAILMKLVSGRNDSALVESTLPSKTFAPSGVILSVNVLFALSLAFAIISSFLAVLGRQWLVYYRKRSGGGPDRQRWEQLKRFLGAERWGLELILDDILPSLLQTGLIIFCISLIIYLNSLDFTLSIVVGVPLYLALAFFIGSAVCTMWDRFCPFHSPLSHFLQWVSTLAPRLAIITVTWMYQKVNSLSFLRAVSRWIRQFGLRRRSRQFFRIGSFRRVKHMTLRLNQPFKWIYGACTELLGQLPQARKEEDRKSLQVIAIHRTICTSEETASLLHATANILALANSDQLKMLWDDETFRERFLELRRSSYNAAAQPAGDFARSVARLYWCATTHILVHVRGPNPDTDNYFSPFWVEDRIGSFFKIPLNKLTNSSPIMIRASCVYVAISGTSDEEAYNYLASCCSAVKGQDSGTMSLVLWLLSRSAKAWGWMPSRTDSESFRAAYMGDDDTTLRSFESAVEAVLDPEKRNNENHRHIVTTILRSVEALMIAWRQSYRITLEEQSRIVGGCEMALRTVIRQDENMEIIQRIRTDLITSINEELPGLDNSSIVPSSVLDGLNIYFQKILSFDTQVNTPLYDGGLDILETFGPVMRQLRSCGRPKISSESHWPYDLEYQADPTATRQTFNRFVLEVDKVFCQMHSDVRLIRDPEVSWCQSRHEPSQACIARMYSLPVEEKELDTNSLYV